ncbi:glutamate--tRNA ligase [Buchnera aphidicola (Aphis helianthi)]|uniref:Glutamate--tRNA ligase n=1 Tax=Buchnera aphidicola (Aphis helianthi) TaxID=2315802 RepID=A0A4D6XPP6_9GAMM|nr:glutamate--tRNA ligase [Buchnera aphidicola]QCI16908.1 glutamate--tRNA ligase [Buchnera aphidicola (Aphis helianthi)]
MKVKTRFAPSPTGDLHIGSIRTALYSWLFARHYNGKFILRIEDTDFQRSKSFSVQSIFQGLKWLGLDWDEGPYFQSKRLDRYKEVIEIMLKTGNAYKCFCSPKEIEQERFKQLCEGKKPRYTGVCRNLKNKYNINKKYTIRFKNPNSGIVTFEDKIRGQITFDNMELDDLIIQRSNGIPTYNFCVVIDDLDMNITHVIRGEDHINNTPRQINILKSLKAQIPVYAHVSMILNENGKKFSKRDNSENIIEYYNKGFLPEALINYIIRLGWSHGNQEIFSLLELKKLFNLDSISKSASAFSIKKLLWLNKYYINSLPLNYISNILKDYMKHENINIESGPNLESLLHLYKNRYHTLKEMACAFRFFYEEFKCFDIKSANKYLVLKNFYILKKIYNKIQKFSFWQIETLSEFINNQSIELNVKIKEISMLLRVVLTGNISSPNISSVMFLLGKEKTLFRLKKSMSFIEKNRKF